MRFGLNSAAANLSEIIGRYLPPVVVGGTLGVIPLGHYSMAYQLTRVPDFIVSGPIYLSTLTAVAQAPNRDVARTHVLGSLRIMVAILAFLFCGLAVTADLATSLLLGPRWSDTAPMLAALAPAGFLICCYSFMGAVLLGAGNSARQFTLSLLCGVAIFTGSVIGSTFGEVGVAIGVSLGAAALLPSYFRALASELHTTAAVIASNLVAPAIAAVVMFVVMLAVRWEISGYPELLQLIVAMGSGFIAFGAAIALVDGRRLADDIRQIRPSGAHLGAESEVVP